MEAFETATSSQTGKVTLEPAAAGRTPVDDYRGPRPTAYRPREGTFALEGEASISPKNVRLCPDAGTGESAGKAEHDVLSDDSISASGPSASDDGV